MKMSFIAASRNPLMDWKTFTNTASMLAIRKKKTIKKGVYMMLWALELNVICQPKASSRLECVNPQILYR